MMLLVVMVAAFVVLGAGQECSSDCSPTSVSFTLESEECGAHTVSTTICSGLCFTEDENYSGSKSHTQSSCNAVTWTYRTLLVPGCPVGLTYPAAESCECRPCNTSNTDCGPIGFASEPAPVAACLTR